MRTRRANRVRNVVEARTPVANVARYFYNDAELRRHHLRDNSMGMWPERRHEFPESIEETLRRVRVR
ncbi:MAG TPA: hypothetical protein VN742_09610 [Candidatus Binataceae bacterium]|nr:hypothetical protein [Candidatus Binataceae bacterium]